MKQKQPQHTLTLYLMSILPGNSEFIKIYEKMVV